MKNSISLYKKEYGIVNFFEIHLLFPRFNCGIELDETTYATNVYRIGFNTEVSFHRSTDVWSFYFCLLGFGFSVIRQHGY